jgi:hypothetical protein
MRSGRVWGNATSGRVPFSIGNMTVVGEAAIASDPVVDARAAAVAPARKPRRSKVM